MYILFRWVNNSWQTFNEDAFYKEFTDNVASLHKAERDPITGRYYVKLKADKSIGVE